MALVDYSGSSDESGDVTPAKRRKTDPAPDDSKVLPPLPANFHDLYSSTVRTSVQDDPTLHGGRRRAKPHVEGNWPAHVYLEWIPPPEEARAFADMIEDMASSSGSRVESLLRDSLGVALPLHVSLSRPLQLRTEEKADFLQQLQQSVTRSRVRAFTTPTTSLQWHPNELRTRWFLVLALNAPAQSELPTLLGGCNDIARQFKQPLLYTTDQDGSGQDGSAPTEQSGQSASKFHISIAWSLSDPSSLSHPSPPLDFHSLNTISFSELKIRIGQDVHTIPLPAARRRPVR